MSHHLTVVLLKFSKTTMVFSIIASALFGCSGSNGVDDGDFFLDPSTEPIKAVIRTALPLGYAASIAMQAVQGNVPANTVVIGGNCNTFPCVRTVTIDISQGDLPLNFSSYGSISVVGLWSSVSQAILTTIFVDMTVGSGDLTVSSLALTPVVMSLTGLKVVYSNININLDTSPVTLSDAEIQSTYLKLDTQAPANVDLSVDMDAWIIEVDDATTPTTYTDDSYTITGGSQGIDISASATEVLQLGILSMEMRPTCNLNPLDGNFLVNQVDVSDSNIIIGQAFFFFNDNCDGLANVGLGLGNYIAATGKSYPLNLDAP